MDITTLTNFLDASQDVSEYNYMSVHNKYIVSILPYAYNGERDFKSHLMLKIEKMGYSVSVIQGIIIIVFSA